MNTQKEHLTHGFFLLGWASSVLQLRTNHDLGDIPKS